MNDVVYLKDCIILESYKIEGNQFIYPPLIIYSA